MISMPLPTRNKVWGFYGAAAGFTDVDAAWSSALPALAKAARASAEGGGGLDSRHGRHFEFVRRMAPKAVP